MRPCVSRAASAARHFSSSCAARMSTICVHASAPSHTPITHVPVSLPPCPCPPRDPCPHIHPWHMHFDKTPSHSSRPLIHSPTPPTLPTYLPVVSLAPVHPLSTCVAPLLSAQSWAALRAYTKASSSTRIVAPANRTSSTCRDPSARGVLFPAPALAPPDRGPCLRSADACPLPTHLALPPLAPLWSHARPPGVYSTK